MMFGNASALTAFPGRGRRFVKRNAAKAPLGRRAAKGIAAILLALCLLLPTAVAGETAQAVEMEIYLIDPCGGCTGRVGAGCGSCTIMDEIAVRYRELFGEDGLQMHFHNLRMDVDGTDQVALDALMAEAGVDPDDVPLPVAFVNGKLFLADGSMDDAMVQYLADGTYPGVEAAIREKAEYEENRAPGRIVYLYSQTCEACDEMSEWLPYGIPSDYEVVAYDIYTPEGEAMLDYFMETLEIPEEDYCVPLIVYGDEWFAGRKSIYLSLASRIQEDPDRQTTILEEIQED